MSEQASPRWFNIIVGIWLFLSAFFWPHTSSQFTNSLIVGAACAAAAAIGLKVPAFRFVNALLAIWLFVSTWVFQADRSGTLWNNAIASLVMLIIALVPNHSPAVARH
jgi:hypothetical protein